MVIPENMEYPQWKRPLSSIVLIAFEAFLGILGLIGGILLISDPSGGSLGFPSDVRESIPFQSFLPVGLFLFFVYDIGPLVLAYGATTRKEAYFGWVSKVGGYHWSWVGGMLLMAVLVIWLTVEGSLIGLDWPATYFTVLIGSVIFIMLILPHTRKFYRITKKISPG
jgi:hypothetical protein